MMHVEIPFEKTPCHSIKISCDKDISDYLHATYLAGLPGRPKLLTLQLADLCGMMMG